LSWAVNLTPGLGTPSLGSSLVSWAISPSPFEPSLKPSQSYQARTEHKTKSTRERVNPLTTVLGLKLCKTKPAPTQLLQEVS